MVAALFDMTSPEFPDDWRYHGRSSGYRYGCRCGRCRERHLQEARTTASRSRFGDHRTCGRCGQTYDRRADADAGTKYCGDCKRANVAYYVHKSPNSTRTAASCVLCEQVFEQLGQRWSVCATCRLSVDAHIWEQLKRHHASREFMVKVISELSCDSCGEDVSKRIKGPKGKYRSALHLDHDHACCASQVSCGKCLRGKLCATCNQGIGWFQDDPRRLEQAANYLRRVI